MIRLIALDVKYGSCETQYQEEADSVKIDNILVKIRGEEVK